VGFQLTDSNVRFNLLFDGEFGQGQWLKDETRDELIEAAGEVFVHIGFPDATKQEVHHRQECVPRHEPKGAREIGIQ
jgi:hypothetical protein